MAEWADQDVYAMNTVGSQKALAARRSVDRRMAETACRWHTPLQAGVARVGRAVS